MFVPHSPDMIFDVERHSDRCVCGASALITCHDSCNIDNGYCRNCAKKRTDFVNQVAGVIPIDTKGFESSTLTVIENLRQSILKERFYYMVDRYFGQHQNENEFVEPYCDASFVAKVYREKGHMMDIFLSSIIIKKEKKFSLANKISAAYSYYKEQLEEMSEVDGEILEELTAKAGGYAYKKTTK